MKPEAKWSDVQDNEDLGNSKALNAIFNGVDNNMFRLINTCTKVKDAWEILKTAHEGTSKIMMSRLQLLTIKFENMRMNEDESISDFNIILRDISKNSFSLGEKISKEKLVRKILRYLSKKFYMKVTTIEEAQDLSTLKVDELIGYLQTFEVTINIRSKKNNRSITCVSNTKEDEDQGG